MRYLLMLPMLILSCARPQERKYPYSISDLPASIRPYLLSIVNEGFIGSKTYEPAASVREQISDADLQKLIKCEHPILRSLALDIACKRDHLDHYKIMMGHLDDTARVSWYFQCASYQLEYVSDYMIWNYEWKTEKEKMRTVNKIIREHNYLMTAYEALGKTDSFKAFHPFIRQMAERDVYFMRYLSLSWYKLAELGHPEDLGFLQKKMDRLNYKLDCNCFSIIAEHPHPDNFAIMERFFKSYYRKWCDRGDDQYYQEETMKCYLQKLAALRNKQSAALLEKLFFRKPFMPCYPPDSTMIREALYEAISANPCREYDKMLPVANAYLDKKRKEYEQYELEMPEADSALANHPKKIRW